MRTASSNLPYDYSESLFQENNVPNLVPFSAKQIIISLTLLYALEVL